MSATERRTWVIDVCRTCGRIAHFPFCEHRDTWTADSGPKPWYVTITVAGRFPTGPRDEVDL